MSKTVMKLLFFYEIDNQECWVSRSARDLVVGKIHGILGVTGQGSWVSRKSVRENEYYISRVTSISWYVQSGRSSRLSIRLSAGENMISGWMSNT